MIIRKALPPCSGAHGIEDTCPAGVLPIEEAALPSWRTVRKLPTSLAGNKHSTSNVFARLNSPPPA